MDAKENSQTPAKKRGRKPTLTPETRKAQYRTSKAGTRQRQDQEGKVNFTAPIKIITKAKIEAYRQEHGLSSLGEALDLMLTD